MSRIMYWLIDWLLGGNRLERLAEAVGGRDYD